MKKKICLAVMLVVIVVMGAAAKGTTKSRFNWKKEVAGLSADGNKILSPSEYPQELIDEFLDGGEIIALAKRSDGSYIVHARSLDNSLETITETDIYGNIIYAKMKSGEELWFDENGNVVHAIDNDGTESWSEYDIYGNVVHSRSDSGFEYWGEYDAYGNQIHYRDNSGLESWTEYNADSNVIYYKTQDGLEVWYDSNGNIIHSKNSNGNEYWVEYDAYGNEIHKKDISGYEEWHDYDTHGNVIHAKSSNGREYWYDYDAAGNEIHRKRNDGYEQWLDYNSDGNVILRRWITSDGNSYKETITYEKVKSIKTKNITRKSYSKLMSESGGDAMELWFSYNKKISDKDNLDEINFVTGMKYKASGKSEWFYTVNGKTIETLQGKGTLKFEKLPNDKLKVTPDNGDWWIVE